MLHLSQPRPSLRQTLLGFLALAIGVSLSGSAWARCGNLPHNWDHAAMIQPEFGLDLLATPAPPKVPIAPKCSGPQCSEAPAPTPAPRPIEPIPVQDIVLASGTSLNGGESLGFVRDGSPLLRPLPLIDGIFHPPRH
ncbi:hypothetical protein [Planctomyces sp. SH-PL14]|uniref:hypothetical protein n=1 Tax=Planctomyces sp. SH-PL14 TaxID=1632864 RepID=UPI00078D81F1|nr:hypothetical protein [Planctomyces sp. SH-PL14]AMV18536.1 hypothetical protein VT03_11635 [Planctomyces sp. SH-PL14]